MTDLAGADRIDTAITVSRRGFPTGAAAAVVASATSYADALAGTPLAAAEKAPLLLNPAAELDPRVATELVRVVPEHGTVYLLGGTASLDTAVDRAVGELGFHVVRYAGVDRYETSVRIAGEGLGNPTTAFLTTGLGFADGLTAGAAAAAVHGAVLLTDGTRPVPSVSAYLAQHGVTSRYAVGGPASIADPGATRLVGVDRYETAAIVANAFFTDVRFVGIASGETYADALTGGADAAAHGGPLLLTPSARLSPVTADYLATHLDRLEQVHCYGGSTALAPGVHDEVDRIVAG